ncbi:dihydrofolate reductase [Fructobacillus evanidus]|uniref:Dihydrofolate reductase n=1 Tax=Fructobacillus evanidus TaxID=3064281 RepID=A0ABM9N0B6_9LACO|nr:Dihydrofolate reductase (FolA) [Fructobacillus sp. LMG 32999]CAK1246193.1 Dihydrofolate reductase (FolA) [Fructobacillus sp. LMG 32999]CAK1251042.1 Dihydrofolate reductase (FolA) [Fructobacillus sp. LMG 32999]CAK1251199.1 Dihydrofolate reductase (FolA) [Fructobacillus sp. LMG 32999]CAK1251437.1 Dihydrofolate reductase (FolA) [Fructobacillus sp. LMG 32999]
MATVKMVWAEDDHHAIGKDGDLPWSIPSDLKHFKKETVGSTMVMGRATWAAIGRPLPKRKTVVLTRQVDFDPGFEEVAVVHTLAGLQALIDDEISQGHVVTVAGGAQVFTALMPMATDLIVTKVAGDFDGDTFVDPVDLTQFTLTAQQEAVDGDYQLTFLTYKRK